MPLPSDIGVKPDEGVKLKIPQRYEHLFRMGENINGFIPVDGNRALLTADSNAAVDAMVADIEKARENVHLLFYIWPPDKNGLKIADALQRASARGVKCRALVDDLGSRGFTRSPHWKALQQAGVSVRNALPIGNPLLGPLKGRIDLRNHRKIVVIDNRITYCGSQNCADPEFRVKAKYAPWVDILVRFKGPIVLQNQYLFACDWQAESGEDISDLLAATPDKFADGFPAQVIGTGPTIRASAMQGALCTSARRGVDTTLIFPKVNDSWIVGAASRSFYNDLLAAGVQIFEYKGGLLHTKSLTCDGEITLIGSANMDRRSFDLNYENNILLYDKGVTADVHRRQESYLENSKQITQADIDSWSWYQKLLNNAVAMFGPVL